MRTLENIGKLKDVINFIEKETSKPEFNAIHKLDHVIRVCNLSNIIALNYPNTNLLILDASCLLHDIAYGKDGKDHELKSAQKAKEFLIEIKYPLELIPEVMHAIEVHRFSNHNNIIPKTIEAKILSDSDKLDAMGAIGLPRLFRYDVERNLYDIKDPFAESREFNDKLNCIDHIYTKAFKIKEKLFTPEAKKMAEQRGNFLRLYLEQLRKELNGES